MKKTVSFLVASFVMMSAQANEKIVVASAASASKAVVVKAKKSNVAEPRTFSSYELESFNASGLPQ